MDGRGSFRTGCVYCSRFGCGGAGDRRWTSDRHRCRKRSYCPAKAFTHCLQKLAVSWSRSCQGKSTARLTGVLAIEHDTETWG